MQHLFGLLEGKKTYLLTAAGILAVLAWSQGLINDQAFQMILSLLGLGSIATLRMAVSKAEEDKRW